MSDNALFKALFTKFSTLFDNTAGEIEYGDLTGHGPEWRASMPLSKQDEGEVMLIFSLFFNGDAWVPFFTLEWCVDGETVDKSPDLSPVTLEQAYNDFTNQAKAFDVTDSEIEDGRRFIEKNFPLYQACSY